MRVDPPRVPASVTVVARRAAGVWTNLPSLTVSMLSARGRPGTAVWFDMGLRYEMLNHLGIIPSAFPDESTLAGLVRAMSSGSMPVADGLVEFGDVVLGDDGAGSGALSGTLGPGLHEYRDAVANFAARGNRIYLVPRQSPSLLALGPDPRDRAADYERAIWSVVDALRPAFTFLTFEGQPEAGLFGALLGDDALLRWALEASEIILCFARHDSDRRFEDSIAVPRLLSRHASWRGRLRVALTRATPGVVVPPELTEVMLGQLPFTEFVGEAVSLGRVPVLQASSRGIGGDGGTAGSAYVHSIDALGARLTAAFGTGRTEPGSNPASHG